METIALFSVEEMQLFVSADSTHRQAIIETPREIHNARDYQIASSGESIFFVSE